MEAVIKIFPIKANNILIIKLHCNFLLEILDNGIIATMRQTKLADKRNTIKICFLLNLSLKCPKAVPISSAIDDNKYKLYGFKSVSTFGITLKFYISLIKFVF